MPRVSLNKSEYEQNRFSDFVRGELRRSKRKQEELATYLNIPRPSLTCRLNGKTDWRLKEVIDTCSFFGMSYTFGETK